MKNLLALAGALVLTFVVVGYFLGWYQVESTNTVGGKEYKIEVNSTKVSDDLNKGREKVREWLNDKEQSHQAVPQPVPAPAPATTVSRKTENRKQPVSNTPMPVPAD
jgi:biotin carboxyl carrier protein